MADMFIRKIDAVNAQVQCDSGIAHELYEHFTYMVPGYQWSPKFKYGSWDGKIHEFSMRTNTIRAGLYNELRQFAEARDYSFEDDGSFGYTEFSIAEAWDFINSLDLPPPYNEVRDYQVKAFVTCIREGRDIQISPTASGKSLIIYLVARYYNMKTLIIVPTKGLVAQMASDFEDYGYRKPIHKIQGGVSKNSDHLFTVSTWQSLYKDSPEYFNQYEVIIGDEVHLFAANSLRGIMDKAKYAHNRFGFTGTLDDSKTNEMCLTGMFGKVHKVITTKELMDQKHVADLKIKGLLLKYPEHVRARLKKMTYHQEIEYLITSPERNRFIRNLVLSLKGNTLVLFRHTAHGKFMFETVKKAVGDSRPVFYSDGGTDTDEREFIRKVIEEHDNAIIFGSRGTMSTGSNTKSLHNIVFASPTKSKISNLQSIGRGLRKSATKFAVVLYDIADDLHWKGWLNHTLNHFKERVQTYLKEKFKFKLYEIDLVVKE
jgi:superfamily II DNA or RNA helicase